MWYYHFSSSGWGICIGDIHNLGSDEIDGSEGCEYLWFSSRYHPQYFCPDELEGATATSLNWNFEINCVNEDWKIALIAIGVSLVFIVLGILIFCKIIRTKKQRRAREMAANQNVATYPTSPTTSSNLQNAPSAPSFYDLNYLRRSNSITANNKINNPVNSEDNPPTYEEFLQSKR